MGVRKIGLPLASIAASVSTPRRRRLVLTVVVALVAAAAGWSYVSRPAPVTRASATRGTAAEIVYGTGAVEPLRWARVATLIKGRIVERCRCEGKSVETGALLARLDDKEAQATLRELRARGFRPARGRAPAQVGRAQHHNNPTSRAG